MRIIGLFLLCVSAPVVAAGRFFAGFCFGAKRCISAVVTSLRERDAGAASEARRGLVATLAPDNARQMPGVRTPSLRLGAVCQTATR